MIAGRKYRPSGFAKSSPQRFALYVQYSRLTDENGPYHLVQYEFLHLMAGLAFTGLHLITRSILHVEVSILALGQSLVPLNIASGGRHRWCIRERNAGQ